MVGAAGVEPLMPLGMFVYIRLCMIYADITYMIWGQI